MPASLHTLQIDPILQNALQEDLGFGDWTTDICVSNNARSIAKIFTREDCRIAGVEVLTRVFSMVDASLVVKPSFQNGEDARAGDLLFEISGPSRSILKSERVALNFFARLCGIATNTRRFVSEIHGFSTELLDTRKTTPGLRILEKYAVSIGGARNHRFGLSDGVIVKENHIRAAGGISAALDKLKQSLSPTIKIEVEVSNFDELKEAIEAGADIVMLDNMSPSEIDLAVKQTNGRVQLEASGGIRLETLREIAATGVDFISTSALICDARPTDLTLLIVG